MTDGPDGSGQIPRRTTRVGDGGAPVSGALAIILTLIPATFLFHRFWEETDEMAKQTEMAHFMKNLSLIGGALILFSFFAREGSDAVPYTLTGGVFGF